MTLSHPRPDRVCPEWHDRLEPFVDGELPADQAELVLSHLRHCTDCRSEVQWLTTLSQKLRTPGDEGAPKDLWHRIATRLDAPDAVPIYTDPRPLPSRRALLAMAASGAAVVAAGLVAVWPSSTPIVAASLNDFITYRAKGWTLDHAAPDARALAAWAQARVSFAVPELKERLGPFEVGGIRLCWLLNRRLLGVTYAKGEDRAVLYLMEAQGLAVPAADAVLSDGTRASVQYMKGHGVAVWSRNDLVFVLVAAEKDFTRFLQGDDNRAEGPRERPAGLFRDTS